MGWHGTWKIPGQVFGFLRNFGLKFGALQKLHSSHLRLAIAKCNYADISYFLAPTLYLGVDFEKQASCIMFLLFGSLVSFSLMWEGLICHKNGWVIRDGLFLFYFSIVLNFTNDE
ncbi:hypothetical protein EYC84_010458 [Monilinia fructicola]|uniref:Uncharacterized protein n=1 Tax=Monilinia fructicola TaxID=38448 RepID=A0A5M9JK60_MONFR|nr:hypothetical protein EYC84_010458 [Monilinia fructicola]